MPSCACRRPVTCNAAAQQALWPLLSRARRCELGASAQVGFEDLKAATDKRYYKFRSQQLLHLDDPNMCAARGL